MTTPVSLPPKPAKPLSPKAEYRAKLKHAKLITGGLGQTTKMPCPSYGLPATQCRTGGKLRDVEGSVCSTCYALKGNYARFKSITAHQHTRLTAITHPEWVDSMVTLIRHANCAYFRWHDSGDLQSFDHLTRIALIAEALPETKFWLPTLERRIVSAWASLNAVPANLIIRVSTPMVDTKPTSTVWLTSSVATDKSSVTCHATLHHRTCEDCRACWSRDVQHVTYLQH